MPRDQAKNQKEYYRCEEPPCIHIVIDERRKIFKIFIEDYEYIIPIEFSKLLKTCKVIEENSRLKKYREASEADEDYLARKYLGAEPLREES